MSRDINLATMTSRKQSPSVVLEADPAEKASMDNAVTVSEQPESLRLVDFLRASKRLANRPELTAAFRRRCLDGCLGVAPLWRFEQALDEFMTS
jgi:hypothetical protein